MYFNNMLRNSHEIPWFNIMQIITFLSKLLTHIHYDKHRVKIPDGVFESQALNLLEHSRSEPSHSAPDLRFWAHLAALPCHAQGFLMCTHTKFGCVLLMVEHCLVLEQLKANLQGQRCVFCLFLHPVCRGMAVSGQTELSAIPPCSIILSVCCFLKPFKSRLC